jgi:hypothetical protein
MRDTLIRVDEETWVNPTQVAALDEETYSDGRWQIHITLKGSGRVVTLTGTRAARVAALLTSGVELR